MNFLRCPLRQVQLERCRGELAELLDASHLACRENVIVSLRLLQHKPHVVADKSPIALGMEISEVDYVSLPLAQDRPRNGNTATPGG